MLRELLVDRFQLGGKHIVAALGGEPCRKRLDRAAQVDHIFEILLVLYQPYQRFRILQIPLCRNKRALAGYELYNAFCLKIAERFSDCAAADAERLTQLHFRRKLCAGCVRFLFDKLFYLILYLMYQRYSFYRLHSFTLLFS